MTTSTTTTPLCPCGAARRRGRTRCDDCRAKVQAADPLRNLDVALLYRLRTAHAACCRCPAEDHDDRGCRECRRCDVPYDQHPDREEAEAVKQWANAGSPLALWYRDWHYNETTTTTTRPTAIAGEIGT